MQMQQFSLGALALAISGTVLISCQSNSTKDHAEEETAHEIVTKMSGDEKVKMLIGPGFAFDPAFSITNYKNPVAGTVGWINGVLNDELDIPAMRLMDGPAGVRIDPVRENDSNTYYATTFPSASLLASSWNVELAEQVGQAIGNEAKEYGVDMWLAPGMNIQRNPVAGRNFEYYSEDPLISGSMAAAVVKGAQSQGIGSTIKHFVANNSETNRRTVNAVVSPRAFREIYLRGFEQAVKEAHPWAVMTSYNSLNGQHLGQRKDVVTTVLRDEWGFDGLVMSDWWSGWDPVEMVKAGVDVIQPGGSWRIAQGENWLPVLQKAYASGELTDSEIDDNVENVIRQVMKSPGYNNYAFTSQPDLAAHIQTAKEAAKEGIVLLKNANGVLPIAAQTKVASFGISQYSTIAIGGGSGSVNSEYTSEIGDALNAMFSIDSNLDDFYQTVLDTSDLEGSIDPDDEDYNANKLCGLTPSIFGAPHFECKEPTSLSTEAIQASVASNDVAVITIGRNTSEGADNQVEKDSNNLSRSYMLNDVEIKLIQDVATAFHAQSKPVVVILNVGNAVDTYQWKDNVDGILLAYLPGIEGGNAIAEIMAGNGNPSGKLAQTFPAHYSDVPSAQTYPGVYVVGSYENPGPENTDVEFTIEQHEDYEQFYNEDIYVGYRYYSTFNVDVSFPFGYGLSYTSFDISDKAVKSNTLSPNGNKGQIIVKATVQNTGDMAGKEVVQAYVSAPEVRMNKPEIELKAFVKTDELQPNGTQNVDLAISAAQLASFDEQNNQWVIEPGEYKVYVSNSSDIRNTTPVTFNVSSEIVVETTTPGVAALQNKYSGKEYIDVVE